MLLAPCSSMNNTEDRQQVVFVVFNSHNEDPLAKEGKDEEKEENEDMPKCLICIECYEPSNDCYNWIRMPCCHQSVHASCFGRWRFVPFKDSTKENKHCHICREFVPSFWFFNQTYNAMEKYTKDEALFKELAGDYSDHKNAAPVFFYKCRPATMPVNEYLKSVWRQTRQHIKRSERSDKIRLGVEEFKMKYNQAQKKFGPLPPLENDSDDSDGDDNDDDNEMERDGELQDLSLIGNEEQQTRDKERRVERRQDVPERECIERRRFDLERKRQAINRQNPERVARMRWRLQDTRDAIDAKLVKRLRSIQALALKASAREEKHLAFMECVIEKQKQLLKEIREAKIARRSLRFESAINGIDIAPESVTEWKKEEYLIYRQVILTEAYNKKFDHAMLTWRAQHEGITTIATNQEELLLNGQIFFSE